MRRLSTAGFREDFARQALLPDWWDEACDDDAELLPDLELRVARFLDVPIATVRDASAPLVPRTYPEAQLRRVRNIGRDRLAPAIHSALQIAAAVLRNLKDREVQLRLPPTSASVWRTALLGSRSKVLLADTLQDLWARGIPVLQLGNLPSPSFQGLACLIGDRPAIVLGHSVDEPARLAFVVAHEVAHIVNGDCAADQPVVDEQEEVGDDHEIEQRADEYAKIFLTGGATFTLEAAGFKDLATKAFKAEKDLGVDAGAVVWSWASRTGDYATAAMAIKALYRARGGIRAMREQFERHVDVEGASESDQSLLRCVGGEGPEDAAAV